MQQCWGAEGMLGWDVLYDVLPIGNCHAPPSPIHHPAGRHTLGFAICEKNQAPRDVSLRVRCRAATRGRCQAGCLLTWSMRREMLMTITPRTADGSSNAACTINQKERSDWTRARARAVGWAVGSAGGTGMLGQRGGPAAKTQPKLPSAHSPPPPWAAWAAPAALPVLLLSCMPAWRGRPPLLPRRLGPGR